MEEMTSEVKQFLSDNKYLYSFYKEAKEKIYELFGENSTLKLKIRHDCPTCGMGNYITCNIFCNPEKSVEEMCDITKDFDLWVIYNKHKNSKILFLPS
jgi:hypothetical protein